MSQQDDSTEDNSDFQDLEEKLTRLMPRAPSDTFSRRVGHRLDAMERNRTEDKIVWMRFAPVAAAACVVLTSTFLLRDHLLQRPVSKPNALAGHPAAAASTLVIDDESTFDRPASQPVGRMVPASDGNFLRGVEPGPIIGVKEDGQPLRELRLELENVQHLYEPETQTNIRIFTPWEEFIRMPAETK